ncbi:MAG TPA: inducible mutagenesis protein A [Methylomirabilota bacterium]|nr:inducible mutagenesis protein A [Methylomirabilota bacterium]
MQPRVHKPNAGRTGAFLRRPQPLSDLDRARCDAEAGAVAAGDDALLGPIRLLDAGADAGDARACADAAVAPAAAPASLDVLRRTVARLEGRMEAAVRLGPAPAGAEAAGAGLSGSGPARRPGGDGGLRLSLGVPAFDGLFPGGGLALAALTEIRGAETRLAGALTGFLTALLVRIGSMRRGQVLWVREARSVSEAGTAAGLGLAHLGFDPSRLLVVTVRDAAEALWAVEEGLGCLGLAAVVGEVQGLPKALDLTASRRLALRARESGVPALLAGHALPEAASAAAVRLAVAPRPSRPVEGFDGGPGFPAWTVTIEKNRDGRTGRVDMEWNSDDRRFRALVPLPVAVAAGDPDGSPGAAKAGEVLAYPAFAQWAS